MTYDWWNAESAEVLGEVVSGLREQIDRSNNERQLKLVALRSVYLDERHDRYDQYAFHRERRSRYNLLQGSVDSTHAQIVASRPRPKIITVGQDHHAQRKAVLRQRWLDGEYDRLKAYEHLSDLAMDGMLYGTGCLKVSPEDGRPCIDKVWAGDLFVDPREERYHRVRTLYQVLAIDRDALMAAYPDHAKAIEEMPGLDGKVDPLVYLDEDSAQWESPHQVGLIEAWRLPINEDKPGRHVIVAHDTVLFDEEWTHETFPFIFFQWAKDPQRFWGQGMIERGMGIQSDLNELTEIIQEAYRLMVPQIWIDESAMVQQDLDDEVGRINKCKPGAGGIQSVVMALSPEVGVGLLNREEALASRVHPVLGVDQLGAKAEKPAGLNSGTALQNYHDQVSQRFLPQGRRYEQTTVDLANLLFFFADQLAEKGHDQTVRAYGKDVGLELIRYGDIRPADDDEIFEVRVKPGSALPKDPAGRIQTVFDMQALGLPLTPQAVLELIEMPDTESMTDGLLADRMLVSQAIDRCSMEPDEEAQPTANAYWDLPMAMGMVTTAIQQAEYQGADKDSLDRLRVLHGSIRDNIRKGKSPDNPDNPEGMADPAAPPGVATTPAPPMQGGPPLPPPSTPPMPQPPPGAPIQ